MADHILKIQSHMSRILVTVRFLKRRGYVQTMQEVLQDDVPDSQHTRRLSVP